MAVADGGEVVADGGSGRKRHRRTVMDGRRMAAG